MPDIVHLSTDPHPGSPAPQPGHHARLMAFGFLCLGTKNLNDADVAKVPEYNAFLAMLTGGKVQITLS